MVTEWGRRYKKEKEMAMNDLSAYDRREGRLVWAMRIFLLLALLATLALIWQPWGSWWQWLLSAGLFALCATGCSMAIDSNREERKFVQMLAVERMKYEGER